MSSIRDAVSSDSGTPAAGGSSPLRILVVGAHPADIFDQSGGTMAHHIERGDWVGCVVLTHGVRKHDKVLTDEMYRNAHVPDAQDLTRLMAERSDVKAQEVIRACGLIGVKDVYFFGADDAVLVVEDGLVRRLARMIRELRPNIVLTHFPKENGGIGSGHAATGQIVMYALHLANGVDPGDRHPPHRVAQVFFFGGGAASVRSSVWGAEGGFYNDVFVDITDVVDRKIACLDALASQGYAGAYARKRIETNDGAFGNHALTAYAEGFISYHSSVHYYLPLSDIDLKVSQLPDHEIIARMSRKVVPPPSIPSASPRRAPQDLSDTADARHIGMIGRREAATAGSVT